MHKLNEGKSSTKNALKVIAIILAKLKVMETAGLAAFPQVQAKSLMLKPRFDSFSRVSGARFIGSIV